MSESNKNNIYKNVIVTDSCIKPEPYDDEDVDENEVIMKLNSNEENDNDSCVMFEGIVRCKDIYYDSYEYFKYPKTALLDNKNGRRKVNNNLVRWERATTLLNHPNH